MNWLNKLFNSNLNEHSKTRNNNDLDYFDGYDAFNLGKIIIDEIRLEGFSSEVRRSKIDDALEQFNKAIKHGYDDSEVYSYRGSAFEELGLNFKALEDYTIAIYKKPKKAIAANFFNRAVIKQLILDFDGSFDDFCEAIRLSKLENDDTAFWNRQMNSIGYASAADFYEGYLIDLVLKKGNEEFETGDYGRAINEYTEAIKKHPCVSAFAKRGEAKQKLEDYEGAIIDFTSAIEIIQANPKLLKSGVYNLSKYNVARIYKNRAESKRALGMITEAQADFNEFERISLN
jgi:tetratricopeptide (TPR) repeat protein